MNSRKKTARSNHAYKSSTPNGKRRPRSSADMPKTSAGILLYRFRDGEPEVLIIHPGGPFWKNKDLGAWSVPKGEIEPGHEPLQTAVRELEEEIGLNVPPDS